jgi:hypothetical protein
MQADIARIADQQHAPRVGNSARATTGGVT